MNSCVYVGYVSHKRFSGLKHALKYKMWSLYLDLDELEAVTKCRGFSHNKFNLMSFYDKDHVIEGNPNLKQWFINECQDKGIIVDKVCLFCLPRTLGYVFNPLSIWYGYRDGKLVAMLYEVRNTYGEKHSYFSEIKDTPTTSPKNFYVSPFITMNQQYTFYAHTPDEFYKTTIKVSQDDALTLIATHQGHRESITKNTFLRLLYRYPLMTLKVIVGIHLEAFKIVRKGGKFLDRPKPPVNPITDTINYTQP